VKRFIRKRLAYDKQRRVGEPPTFDEFERQEARHEREPSHAPTAEPLVEEWEDIELDS